METLFLNLAFQSRSSNSTFSHTHAQGFDGLEDAVYGEDALAVLSDHEGACGKGTPSALPNKQKLPNLRPNLPVNGIKL